MVAAAIRVINEGKRLVTLEIDEPNAVIRISDGAGGGDTAKISWNGTVRMLQESTLLIGLRYFTVQNVVEAHRFVREIYAARERARAKLRPGSASAPKPLPPPSGAPVRTHAPMATRHQIKVRHDGAVLVLAFDGATGRVELRHPNGRPVESFQAGGVIRLQPDNKIRLGARYFERESSIHDVEGWLQLVIAHRAQAREDAVRSIAARPATSVRTIVARPATANPPTARSASTSTRARSTAPAAQSRSMTNAAPATPRPAIPIKLLLVAGAVIYGLARGVGGLMFQWNCEDYASKKAVDAILDGHRPYDSYSFTGLGIGYCEPSYSDR